MDTTSQAFSHTIAPGAILNLAFFAILVDISSYRPCDMELVWVWVGVLGLLQFLDLTAPNFIVLLYRFY